MRVYYASGALSQRAQEFACFGHAKAYSDIGSPSQAIHFCIEGNFLAQRACDVERPRADLAELRKMAASGAFRHIAPGTAVATAAPIFIVGMPRSGTTLVETILARHPDVLAGGEMLHMLEVERALLAWMRSNRGYAGGPYEMLKSIPADYYARNAEAVLNRVTSGAK